MIPIIYVLNTSMRNISNSLMMQKNYISGHELENWNDLNDSLYIVPFLFVQSKSSSI